MLEGSSGIFNVVVVRYFKMTSLQKLMVGALFYFANSCLCSLAIRGMSGIPRSLLLEGSRNTVLILYID